MRHASFGNDEYPGNGSIRCPELKGVRLVTVYGDMYGQPRKRDRDEQETG